MRYYGINGKVSRMSGNILNLAYAKAFDLVPLCSPVTFLYDMLFHQRTTNQFHRQSFQTSLVQCNKFYEYSTVKDDNGALETESSE